MIPYYIMDVYKHTDDALKILNSLNIKLEFYETYENSMDIYYDDKSKKIKTILKKYFIVNDIGYCSGMCNTDNTLNIQKDMIIFNISLKKKYIK